MNTYLLLQLKCEHILEIKQKKTIITQIAYIKTNHVTWLSTQTSLAVTILFFGDSVDCVYSCHDGWTCSISKIIKFIKKFCKLQNFTTGNYKVSKWGNVISLNLLAPVYKTCCTCWIQYLNKWLSYPTFDRTEEFLCVPRFKMNLYKEQYIYSHILNIELCNFEFMIKWFLYDFDC